MAKKAKKSVSRFEYSKFKSLYMGTCLVVLAVTTCIWSYLGAKLQSGNADQLVNSYLFENSKTFHGAYFPSQHTFLFKWPLFYAVKLLGNSSSAIVALTVFITLVTVGLFAYMLYRIERRPHVFGTLCLALASVLLLVPAVPYSGALLPVNMAMIATRNLEYVLYIAVLALIVRRPRIKTRTFWLAILLLSLLIASDKLFLSLSLVGAAIGIVAYALTRRWNLVTLSVKWLLATVGGFLAAWLILWLIDSNNITHIAAQVGLGPYALVNSLKTAALGSIYAVLGVLTNFGANPAYDSVVLKNIPHQAITRLFSADGLAYVCNAIICGLALVSTVLLISGSLFRKNPKHDTQIAKTKIVLLLSWSSLAAVILFVITNHYYAVDSRYLTITLFTGFGALALMLSRRQWQPRMLITCGTVLLVSILASLPGTFKTYHINASTINIVNDRNDIIAQVLEQKHTTMIVGDYWRVVPTKQHSKSGLRILPLQDCTHPRNVLSSQAWQSSLKNRSFAYLLSYDQKLTDFPSCTAEQITSFYGHPNASVVVAGTLEHPKELLLFYDKGIHASSPKSSSLSSATIAPIDLNDLLHTSCTQPTVMNLVAHEDDDLLFLSPDLLHDIKAHHCVRTVYVTAGDAGSGEFYWLGRQQGSEAAYSQMLGSNEVWVERIVKLADNQFVTIANPRGNTSVSLIFMHLPDGNINGSGFRQYHNESLARLEAGVVPQLHSVDNQSNYTSSQVVAGLTALMHAYQPTEFRTQANYVGRQYPDHSDHMAVGRYAEQAYQKYEKEQFENLVTIPIKKYIGYPVHSFPDNVFGLDLDQKEAAFFAYAKYDGGVCRDRQQCEGVITYNSYLRRQYLDPK